ncbi:MAG: hypothetical protein C4534_08710 [Gaiellales bacterium]|nr:MAG: hypothetical protein C4534_08710 [Gaiellales bacterium]
MLHGAPLGFVEAFEQTLDSGLRVACFRHDPIIARLADDWLQGMPDRVLLPPAGSAKKQGFGLVR